jgi:hypothetical protein
MQSGKVTVLMLVLVITIPAPRGWDARAAVGPDLDASSSVSEAAPTGNPLWAVPLDALHATRDRPLFSASRRPPAPPPVFAEAGPPPARAPPLLPDHPSLVLLGTISGDALHVGIFHDSATTKTIRLSVGENFDGWLLRAVSSIDARFENEGRAATLLLRPTAQLAMKGDTAPDMPATPLRRKRR